MPSVVRTDGLTKDFRAGFWRPRPHRALDALSVDIPAGGVFGLLGPNGAGKSTTLKLLLGLLWPTAGRAEMLGRPPGDLDARRRLGFLPEQPSFYDYLTAEELLVYFAGLFGFRGADARRRASAALDRVGLGAARRRPIRQYSKGMTQRVGLAQAFVNDPALLILDEPMSGLDPIGRREVRDMILGWRDEGRTVIFSSHILSDAELLCSRVAILSKGRLAAEGSLDRLLSDEARGWELVIANLDRATADRIAPPAARVTAIADARFSITIGRAARPEALVAAVAAAGASLVSVTPVRASLEDVFLEAVGGAEDRARQNGSAPAAEASSDAAARAGSAAGAEAGDGTASRAAARTEEPPTRAVSGDRR